MAKIDILPPEILIYIIEVVHKGKGDLKSLRLVNHSFASLVAPLLFSAIRCETTTPYGYDPGCFELLAAISRPASTVAPHVQVLNVRTEDELFSRHHFVSGRPRTIKSQAEEESEHWASKVQSLYNEHLATAISSLKNLTSLTVSRIPHSLSSASLWRALTNADVRLLAVDVSGDINTECLTYLSSYTGLEILKLKSEVRMWCCPSFEVTDREDAALSVAFIKDVLPRHAESLLELSITALEEGPWALGLDNLDAYVRCIKLHTLDVNVNSTGLSGILVGAIHSPLFLHLTHSSFEQTRYLNIAQTLVHLRFLNLSPARSRAHRGLANQRTRVVGGANDNPELRHFALTRKMICDEVKGWRPSYGDDVMKHGRNIGLEIIVEPTKFAWSNGDGCYSDLTMARRSRRR
ncbi:hypothetical protein VNI00_007736 [Paramarasmius palmivorus]|uniref:F-box domain-containing protein n=1 Tax=Paramarasmius palmivorus TaxID=297713 RepID=A0AAW0D3V6_9AGAR